MYLEREAKQKMKRLMRKPNEPFRSPYRFRVSVWLDDEGTWLEDYAFRYKEDAVVHANRWGRLYGCTVTKIEEVLI